MNLQPTMSLRWVERELIEEDLDKQGEPFISLVTHYPCLQQWWADSYGKGEWRDVPSGVE